MQRTAVIQIVTLICALICVIMVGVLSGEKTDYWTPALVFCILTLLATVGATVVRLLASKNEEFLDFHPKAWILPGALNVLGGLFDLIALIIVIIAITNEGLVIDSDTTGMNRYQNNRNNERNNDYANAGFSNGEQRNQDYNYGNYGGSYGDRDRPRCEDLKIVDAWCVADGDRCTQYMRECHELMAQSAGVKGTNVLVGFLVLTLIFILVVAVFEAKEISDNSGEEGGVDGHDDVFNNAPNNALVHNGTLYTQGSLKNQSKFIDDRQTPSRMV